MLLWLGWGIQVVSPLLPLLAAVAHFRSTQYVAHPWMRRLAATLLVDLLVNWTLLGMAMSHVHNAWLTNLAFLPQALLFLWVLSGLRPRPFPAFAMPLILMILVIIACFEAQSAGIGQKWITSMTVFSALVLLLCLWQLKELFILTDGSPIHHQPAFWLLGSWILMAGNHLTFYPLVRHFLKHLPQAWILVPWLMTYLIGLSLNICLSRTFLCRNSTSS